MSLSQRSTAAINQPVSNVIERRRKASSKIKMSSIGIYISVFALLVVLVAVGYQEPRDKSVVASASSVNASAQIDETSVDEVVATNVAASVAQAANLPIATSVANLAISTQSKSDFVQTSGTATTKPQLIESSTENRTITSYTTKVGDTVASLAAQFKVSAQTIKWANNLTTDALEPGKVLQILPVDGVLYTVKAGDTVDSIASKYNVDKTRLVLYNDLDVSGLTPDAKIILPSGNLPDNEKPGYVAPVTETQSTTYYSGQGTGFGGNTWRISVGTPDGPYAHGNCTLYAYNRRKALGLPVGGNWGNASSWAYSARADGLTVNNTPSVGAIMQNGGGYGHVAIVEEILPNGNLSISEMNAYVSGGGYNIVSGRIVSAGNVSNYLYIH